MSDHDGLTFDADGFVRMDALPDVDPDLAVAVDALERVREVLHAEPLPASLDATWDAALDDIDRLDFNDSIALVPDDSPIDGEASDGPIVLVDDQGGPDAPAPAGFAPEQIGRDRPEPAAESHPIDSEAPDAPWSPPDSDAWIEPSPIDEIAPVDDDTVLGFENDGTDDLLDVDIVELHHEDGDDPPPGYPH